MIVGNKTKTHLQATDFPRIEPSLSRPSWNAIAKRYLSFAYVRLSESSYIFDVFGQCFRDYLAQKRKRLQRMEKILNVHRCFYTRLPVTANTFRTETAWNYPCNCNGDTNQVPGLSPFVINR